MEGLLEFDLCLGKLNRSRVRVRGGHDVLSTDSYKWAFIQLNLYLVGSMRLDVIVRLLVAVMLDQMALEAMIEIGLSHLFRQFTFHHMRRGYRGTSRTRSECDMVSDHLSQRCG